MSVIGYDAIHNLVPNIPWNAHVVMGYDTGSQAIKWTGLDFRRFPKARVVHIDQAGPGSPVLTATVRDVETGGWTPETAIKNREGWNAERPTIYCNLSTLPDVLANGWRGDLWLAILTSNPPTQPPVVPGCNVVAVQYRFESIYDVSVVFDDHWPRKAVTVSEVQYAAPTNVREIATVSLAWDASPAVGDSHPTGYTVAFFDHMGQHVADYVTDRTYITGAMVPKGAMLEAHVWPNGGTIAPKHTVIHLTT